MKIQKIIFAVDDSVTYAGFWEINSEICTKILGITPVLFHLSNEDSDFYSDKYGIVKKVKTIEGIDTGFQAQIYRIYGTSYFQDEVCMLSDIDMLLFNKKYITESVQKIGDDDFVILGSDAYSEDRPECVYPYNGNRLPMCYLVGKGKTFNKITNTSINFEEYCKKLETMNLGWDTDEIYLGNMVERNRTVKINKIKRGYSSTFCASRRIEKWNFIENGSFKLDLNGKIDIENFIDCHCARPLSEYTLQINNLKNQILNHNNMTNQQYCIFTNDNFVKILLPDNEYSAIFSGRDNHEQIFRRINTILINNNFIQGNIIDLGSWMGDNAIPWSKNINGIVYAIDPYDKYANFIKDVMRINNIKNIVILQEVVSDGIKMVSTDHDLSHATFYVDGRGSNKFTSTSLDVLYANNVIKDIDYIHLDVEGMEKFVIAGADRLISDCQPIITFEQHINSDDYTGLSNSLKDKNYKVFLINETLLGCNADCRNLLAIPNRLDFEEIKSLISESLKMDNILTLL